MLKNMQIGKRLMITFILVAMLSSIGGGVGFAVMRTMNSGYRGALINYGFAQGDIGLFNTEFNNGRTIIRDLIIESDSQEKEVSSAKLSESNTKLTQYFSKMKNEMSTKKEISNYNDINDNLTKYNDIKKQIADLALANKDDDAYLMMKNQAVPIATQIITATEAIMSEKTGTGNQLSAQLNQQNTAASMSILIVILASLIISLIIALTIARSISKPVKQMSDAAKKMAEGDLSVHINVNSKDEIGQLGFAFSQTIETLNKYITDLSGNLSKMAQGDLCITRSVEYKGDFIELEQSMKEIVASFNDTLTYINQASEQVASGSEQVSSGAQALAQGATEQASSVQELSASITEISAHVRENAEHATSASKNVNQVSTEIEISNQHMGEMVVAMSQINNSSSQIGKIIKTIEDIAFQTNILALNAAVEAARAGAAGKGFAVVADEVRNLASKSAEAAKDTTALIENSMKQVENGTKIADETAKSLLRVVDGAKAVSDTVEKISQASIRQSEAIDQVSLGVDQISSVVQTNSATAEESAASSEELSGQAEKLKELVRKFKLRDQNIQTNQMEHSQVVEEEPQQPEQ